MPTVVQVFTVLHILVGGSGMLMNLLLVYTALTKTPKVIKAYSVLIINFAITDFFACFFDVFVQQRVVAFGISLIHVAGGFCKYISPVACYTGLSFEMHCLAHTLWSLLLSFSYRYYILVKSAPTRQKMICVVLLVYIPSLIQFIVFFWTEDDEHELIAMLHDKFPHYSVDEVAISGMKNIFTFSSLYVIGHMTIPAIPVYMVIHVLRKKIIGRLSQGTTKLTDKTKKLHKQLLVALTYQALLPVFFVSAVISYSLGQFSIINNPALEYVTFLSLLMIPVLSPITSFVFVTPYRQFVLSLIRKTIKSETNTVHSSQTPALSSKPTDSS